MANLASENINYTLLPMWMGASKLTRAVEMIQTKYCIPIHPPNSPYTTYSPSTVMPFTSPHRLIILPGQTIELSNDTTPHIGQILRVPQDYSTIQAAIDTAQNSDTVLVSEGRYYENINYYWKKIVVTSRYYITQDWQTVQNTIIDGSTAVDKNNASTVTILNGLDSTTVLDGFTITGGTGTLWIYGANRPQEGGGIILNLSSAIIRNNIITNNMTRTSAGVITGGGGGISSLYSNPTIYNNVIVSNTSGYAGGVVLNWSKGKIRNNIVYHNTTTGQYGAGGLMIWQAPQNGGIAENNIIVGNISTTAIAGGISISVPDASTIPVVKNNIVWGNRQATGGQIANPQHITGYNDVEDYSFGTNFSVYPQLEEESFLLSTTSPCIDAGDPASTYNDIEDPLNPGMALPPSKGMVRNDIGAFGGPSTKILSSLTIYDIRVSRTSLSFSSLPGQQVTSYTELLNASSKKVTIDSVTLTNTSVFSLNKNFAGQVFDLFATDSIKVNFKSDIRGMFYDYHQSIS